MARALGYRAAPIDELLAFHVVFGRAVADISINALANLGYARCRFGQPVYPGAYETAVTGSAARWDDYAVGERIDHVDGATVEEAEHMMATRLHQNPAKVHVDQHRQGATRLGRRLVYGGHVISLARALSFNGLANAFRIAAINGGRHVAPCVAGDTVHAWSEVLEKAAIPGRADVGALRVRTVAAKDHPCADFPFAGADGKDHPAVLLELDAWLLMPRRAAP